MKMMNNISPPRMSVLAGQVLALIVPAVVVGGAILVVLDKARGPVDLSEEWGVFAIQWLLVGAPFALLAVLRARTRAWVTGVAVTLVFWSVYVADAYLNTGGGANIGMGLIMLASPLFVAAAALMAGRNKRQR